MAALAAQLRDAVVTFESILPGAIRMAGDWPDLVQRRNHAVGNGWKGEIEGIDLTLTFLRSKRTQTRRSVSLGMPAIPATAQ
jgi:hypothetical protein